MTLSYADIRLKTSVQPREALAGDPIQVTFSASYSPDVTLTSWPREKNFGPFEVVHSAAGRPRAAGQNLEQDIQYTVTIFDVGISTFPSLSIEYQLQNGATGQIQTPEVPILIKSLLTPQSKDIREIKGPIGQGWKIALAAALALLAGLGAYFWWRHRKLKRLGLPAGPPPRPAHEIALEALAALEADIAAPAKIFYSHLADILRQYIENRFQVPALDRTTSELFYEMKRRGLDMSLTLEPREVLDTSDLAKFAKLEPFEDERRQDLEKVKKYILNTQFIIETPRPDSPPKQGGR